MRDHKISTPIVCLCTRLSDRPFVSPTVRLTLPFVRQTVGLTVLLYRRTGRLYKLPTVRLTDLLNGPIVRQTDRWSDRPSIALLTVRSMTERSSDLTC